MSGYTSCACRDCFEIAISEDESVPELCNECEEAGCDCSGESECKVPPEDDELWEQKSDGESPPEV
jgi:hypothetical protein